MGVGTITYAIDYLKTVNQIMYTLAVVVPRGFRDVEVKR